MNLHSFVSTVDKLLLCEFYQVKLPTQQLTHFKCAGYAVTDSNM